MAKLSDDLRASRAQWRWRGIERPSFARVPGPGQESVWDYPRPPRIAAESREVIIQWEGHEIARTQKALRILETAHPPSFYVPWTDVERRWLQPGTGTSLCEWKGAARYWSLISGDRRLPNVAWSYPDPLAGAEILTDFVAFYPAGLACSVGGAPVSPQPGGFYGGWITPELVGPFKGDPGSHGW